MMRGRWEISEGHGCSFHAHPAPPTHIPQPSADLSRWVMWRRGKQEGRRKEEGHKVGNERWVGAEDRRSACQSGITRLTVDTPQGLQQAPSCTPPSTGPDAVSRRAESGSFALRPCWGAVGEGGRGLIPWANYSVPGGDGP